MRIRCILFLLVFISHYMHAQSSLSGVVYDENDKGALTGVTVLIPDLKKSVTTDKEGKYIINKIPSGRYLVEVRFFGYEIAIYNIYIKGDVEADFALSVSHMELNEVVITGSAKAIENAVNPVQTVSVSSIDLAESASSNIIDALTGKPGVEQISTGPAISKPVIRGLGGNRVIVLNNGVRQEGQQWGEEHGVEADEFSFDRVEVVKGPGSLMYGSDALGGVINLLPPHPENEGTLSWQLLSAYHTNNKQQSYSLKHAGNINGNYWRAQGTLKSAADYKNRFDGNVYNSGFNEKNVNAAAGLLRKWGYLGFNFSSFNQEAGIISGDRDSLGRFTKGRVLNDTLLQRVPVPGRSGYEVDLPKQKINHLLANASGKWFLGKSALFFSLACQQNKRREIDYIENDEIIQEGNALYLLLNSFHYDAVFHRDFSGWESAAGINGYHQENKNKGYEFLIPDYKLDDLGVFALTGKERGKFYYSGGLRYNVRRINTEPRLNENGINELLQFSGFDRMMDAVAGSLGLSYKWKKGTIIKLNVSRGFRSPSIAELASNGIHEGAYRIETGNKALHPETSLQADLGLLYNSDHISFEAGIFYHYIDDYIYSRRLVTYTGADSLVEVESGNYPVFQFVQDVAVLYGGEVLLDFHPHPMDWLHFENSFSYVEGKRTDLSGQKYLPFIPAPEFQSEIRAQFKQSGKYFRGLYINLTFNHHFRKEKIFSDYNTETLTDAYSIFNCGAGTDVGKDGRTLFSVYFSVTNLADTGYQSHLSRIKYASINPATGRQGIFNMGRNLGFKIIVPLQVRIK